MPARAIIFHGTGGHPDYCWYRWQSDQLIARGYEVELPHLPGINIEPIGTFLPKVLDTHRIDENTVLIGHSGGAALLLALLERVDVTVPLAVLAAGYCTPPNNEDEPVLKEKYDWARIKSHAADFVFINSVADPYGCDARQGRAMFDKLGGTQIIQEKGHFETPTFELLNRIVP